jgi:hypothetical protein
VKESGKEIADDLVGRMKVQTSLDSGVAPCVQRGHFLLTSSMETNFYACKTAAYQARAVVLPDRCVSACRPGCADMKCLQPFFNYQMRVLRAATQGRPYIVPQRQTHMKFSICLLTSVIQSIIIKTVLVLIIE